MTEAATSKQASTSRKSEVFDLNSSVNGGSSVPESTANSGQASPAISDAESFDYTIDGNDLDDQHPAAEGWKRFDDFTTIGVCAM